MHDEEQRDGLIERVARELRAPVRLSPGLDDRVMAAIRRDAPSRRGVPAIWQWLRRPRPLMVSPLGGLALAAGIAAVMVIANVMRDAERGAVDVAASAASAPAPDTVKLVQFVLVAPNASSVSVVGDFNDWSLGSTPLHRTSADGVWSVGIPLAEGRYTYTFIVDGTEWVADPAAPPAVDDDFGRPSSVITVGDAAT
ncbi:MAG TPA: isoamylase early set domain-containing protein [Gemmatimonadaceae bacterium]|nr:isoamylase early set domain-containing protein [Gemmatimonadaceae bacterium]